MTDTNGRHGKRRKQKMLKRKIEQRLKEWKNTVNHKPLIIKGAGSVVRLFLF